METHTSPELSFNGMLSKFRASRDVDGTRIEYPEHHSQSGVIRQVLIVVGRLTIHELHPFRCRLWSRKALVWTRMTMAFEIMVCELQ
jgi:hypothetical protein